MAAQRRTTAGKQTRAADLTGKRKAEQEAAHAEELKARQAEIALQAEIAEEEKANTVVDYTKVGSAAPEVVEVEEVVEVKPKTTKIRVREPIEQMVFGRDPVTGNLRFMDFEPGIQYEVLTEVADHLAEIGLVWDR